MKKLIINIYNYVKYHLWYSSFKRKLTDTLKVREGRIKLFEKYFCYHYGKAFYITYNEVFTNEIYRFETQSNNPVIIDCGANMGLSILFFSMKYPNAEIIAFEPDESVLPFLEKNILNYKLNNVQLIKSAVWVEETELKFFTDEGMGGRVNKSYENQIPQTIKAVRLRDYLSRKIDMLKIDIEGSEYMILRDCDNLLINVNHIFIEYHSFIDDNQHLEDVLSILKKNGFRYHLKESFSRERPFIDKELVCEKFDMAINIFGYKN
tara:strand:+ start:854 stop:1645 length:792 start_codon:yes stop_codon:yes gene_type:complete